MAPPDRCGGSSNVLNDSFLASDEVNESFKTPQPHLRTAPAVLLETWADPPGRQPPPLPGGASPGQVYRRHPTELAKKPFGGLVVHKSVGLWTTSRSSVEVHR